MIADVKQGEFVYIRAEFRAIDDATGCAWVWVRNPKTGAFTNVPVPQSQVVCREPHVMEADGGMVRGIE